MHIKRDISIWNLKRILNVLFRMPGFSDRSKRVLAICVLSATIQITTLTILYINGDVTTLLSPLY